jgi:hypothetical protein
VFSLLGVLVGATMQHFFILSSQKSRLKTQAYGQYIENNAKLVVLEQQKPVDAARIAEASALRDSAKFLIGLCRARRRASTPQSLGTQ